MGWLKPTGATASFFLTGSSYTYKKGETILRAEDMPSGVYYLQRGYVKVYSVTPDGTENIYCFLQAGGLFPARWEFVPQTNNKLNYQALSPVIVWRKSNPEFESLRNADITASNEMLDVDMAVISMLTSRISNLEHTDSYARVIVRLIDLSNAFGVQEGINTVLQIPLTHYDLAHTINMSRETTSRDLKKLKEKGLVSEHSHIITIHGVSKLEQELDIYYANK